LAEDPRPFGSEKLQGFQNLYRLRVGKYRIIYEIDKATSVVTIAKVEHRKSVYRKR
jgi:mRNA interferase RelE/StbE